MDGKLKPFTGLYGGNPSDELIAAFFLKNGLSIVAINPDDDLLPEDEDRVGEFFLGFGGFRLDVGTFKTPREAFQFMLENPFRIMMVFSLICNHLYHEEVKTDDA